MYVFRSLHTLPSRAIQWLLSFIQVLLTFLGQYSQKISEIALAFPGSNHRRANFLAAEQFRPSIDKYVVCKTCYALNRFHECLEKHGSSVTIRSTVRAAELAIFAYAGAIVYDMTRGSDHASECYTALPG